MAPPRGGDHAADANIGETPLRREVSGGGGSRHGEVAEKGSGGDGGGGDGGGFQSPSSEEEACLLREGEEGAVPSMHVVKRDGRKEPVMFDKITARIRRLCWGLDERYIDPVLIAQKVWLLAYCCRCYCWWWRL